MPTPILPTKLYVPPPRPKVVLRSRLIERLNEGMQGKLTLISAAAGFGKTTLVSEWVANCNRPTAWLSLDEKDNDLTPFLTYLVTALQTIAPNLGEVVLGIVQSPQPPPIDSILTTLLNEISTFPDHFILVLDDFHVIDARSVNNALTFLVEHLPSQMHLVIATREDPQLPLARLRVRGQLTELRVADLRFTASEAAEFLSQVMGLHLSAMDVAVLETRTEGWIAGLQLAAISMEGRTDTSSFIQAFTGSHRFVLDYLMEEVLQRQPDRVRNFLLQTSILDRLSGPLCDAVTGQEDSGTMLDTLERGNMLIVPLDDQRHWFRYHHLFADVLQVRSLEEQPDQVLIWHRRASEWYEQNGLRSDAVRHALAAKDFERAARLVELVWPAMRSSRQEATLRAWVKALPDELVRASPVLSVGYAWALLDGGELEAAEARLRDAERWLDKSAEMTERSEARSSDMIVRDEKQFRSLPASIANARAYHAQALGDLPGTVTHARRALELLAEDDYYERGTTAALLGLAYWASGNLEAAYQSFADGLASLQMGGGILVMIGGTFVLAEIRKPQGRLHEAAQVFDKSLQVATTQGEPPLQGTPELYLGLSELQREWGDLEAAKELLLKGKALGEKASLPGYEYLWCIAQARIKQAEGDVDGALNLLHEAGQVYYQSPIPDVRPIAALKARVWVAVDRLAEALGWLRERGLSVDDELSYLREYEHITLARVLIAEYKRNGAQPIHEALGLMERLLQAAEEGKRMGSVIEILMLQALAHQVQRDFETALVSLERALTLAEPEGYVRLFIDEGPLMVALLVEAGKHGIATNYVHQLLVAAGNVDDQTRVTQQLPDPLSERELDVLRLLRTDLSGPEIARELTVSLNTVRTHTKNIYSKLGVNSRRAAIRYAEELNLL